MKKENLLISFSGGETSAYMTKWLIDQDRYKNVAVVFANTGQENEATLEFVNRCDAEFGFSTVWIEASIIHGERRTGFKIVNYNSANRTGEPFEESIKKYGIPNQKFKDCTRNLKRYPIENYAKSIGWGKKEYDLAIGIRADEIDRVSSATDRNIIYPLAFEHPMTKPKINSWWEKQPFRLNLKGYQGNCKWCWKKSLRKHFTIISENPEFYDFPRRMEKEHPYNGPEFRKVIDPKSALPPNYRRKFFRGNISTEELFEMYEKKKNAFIKADDDAMIFDEELDVGAGCEESCEVFSDEDEK